MFSTLLAGCSSETVSFNEKIPQEYVKNGRAEKFFDLTERYGDTKVILWLNSESGAEWVTNFSLWLLFKIIPDIPECCAADGVFALIQVAAWCLGVTLTGGGILAVLAWFGTMAGGILGVPPTIDELTFL
ncbi:MAG: hypothetical protein LBN28_03545 [Desulfovibrio sp.]|jgi:hypothetical protein|nr:hypothetical protein [Desulfovibrio sp.]